MNEPLLPVDSPEKLSVRMEKILVQELSSPGCVHCAEFERFWHSIEASWPNVEYQKIMVTTPEGMELAAKHGIFASPGIIVNGTLFSTGGVNKDKFVAKLQELSH